jgi:hypothetical protein
MYYLASFLSLSLVYGELIVTPLKSGDYGVYVEVQISGAWGKGETKIIEAKLDIARKDGDTFHMPLNVGKTITTRDIEGTYAIKQDGDWKPIAERCKFTRIEEKIPEGKEAKQNEEQLSTISLGPSSQIMNNMKGFAWIPGQDGKIVFVPKDDDASFDELCDKGGKLTYMKSGSRSLSKWAGLGGVDIVDTSGGVLHPSKFGKFVDRALGRKELRRVQFTILGELDNTIVLYPSEMAVLNKILKKKDCGKINDNRSFKCKKGIDINALPSIQYSLKHQEQDEFTKWTIGPKDYIVTGSKTVGGIVYTTSIQPSKLGESIEFPSFFLRQQTVVFNKETMRVGFCPKQNSQSDQSQLPEELKQLEVLNELGSRSVYQSDKLRELDDQVGSDAKLLVSPRRAKSLILGSRLDKGQGEQVLKATFGPKYLEEEDDDQ